MTLPTKLGLHLSHLRFFIIRIECCICNTTTLVLSKEFHSLLYVYGHLHSQLITFIQHMVIHQAILLKATWVICLCMSFPPNKYAIKASTQTDSGVTRIIKINVGISLACLQYRLTTNKLVRHILNHVGCCYTSTYWHSSFLWRWLTRISVLSSRQRNPRY